MMLVRNAANAVRLTQGGVVLTNTEACGYGPASLTTYAEFAGTTTTVVVLNTVP